MADVKKEKIAFARKKLKQYKEKSTKSLPVTVPSTKTIPDQSPSFQVDSYSINSGNKGLDQVRNGNGHEVPSLLSSPFTSGSSESLQQMSLQINGLLNDSLPITDDQNYEKVLELEARNRELASLSEKLNQSNLQLATQLQQSRFHVEEMNQQLVLERKQLDEKQKKDVSALKEQLQVHIQTIGILVAEKTELQSQLNQSQKIGQERYEELEELDGRLKANRLRVSDLERNLSASSSTTQQQEKALKELSKTVDKLKTDNYNSSKSHEETQQMYSELHEKYNKKISECSHLAQKVDDAKRKLEMAELKISQLTNHSDESSIEQEKRLEKLQSERDSLLDRVRQYDEAIQKEQHDKDQITRQYQEYLQHLQNQNQDLTLQMKSLTDEREAMMVKCHQLERREQQLLHELEDLGSTRALSAQSLEELKQLKDRCSELESSCSDLNINYDGQVRDNQQLSRLLQEKEVAIADLEQTVSKLSQDAGHRQQLLDSVHSDKTALSRAISQNKELKNQLSELQNGFVKMSNDNMEIMTQLSTEQHSSRELGGRLAQSQSDLKGLQLVLSQKEAELEKLKENSQFQIKKDGHNQEQIADRLRHYEAQAKLVEMLQTELHSAQSMVHSLTSQNGELRAMLIENSSSERKSSADDSNNPASDKIIDSLTAAVQQLEVERGHLIEQLADQRSLSDKLTVKLADVEQENIRHKNVNQDNGYISLSDFKNLETALHLIEAKYSEVMKDKAELSDKADRLEYLVTQLQGESDTIGEYISLYHHQRALLQQREHQKNEYINQLAADRELLQCKLSQLQSLVMQMMGERHLLERYNFESKSDASNSFLTNGPVQNTNHVKKYQKSQDRDWPDYTSSSSGGDSDTEESKSELSASSPVISTQDLSRPEGALSVSGSSGKPESTATRILDLISEIHHSNYMTDNSSNFSSHTMHCKFCKGSILTV